MKKTKIIFSLAGLATVSTVLGPVLTSCSSSSTVVIAFNTNGGTSIQQQRVNKGECATRPTDPTKDGYDFAGWYTDAALTQEFDFATPLQQSITLYAKWSDGQVNMGQWMSAFSKLSDTALGGKNFTLASTYMVGTVTKKYDILCGGNTYKLSLDDSSVTTSTNIWEEYYYGAVITTTQMGKTQTTDFSTTSYINNFLVDWFSPFVNKYYSATYNTSTRSYSLYDSLYGNVTIKFDGKLNVESLTYSYLSAGVTYSFVTSISNYEATSVTDVPEGSRVLLGDENFTAADKLAASTSFTVSGTPLIFVNFPVSKILNFDSSNPTYVKFGNTSLLFNSSGTRYIAVDSEQLTTEEYSMTDTYIKIDTEKLQSTSTILMVFSSTMASTKITELVTNIKFYQ